jgi:transcriptional regulator with XRE-family HTH domain
MTPSLRQWRKRNNLTQVEAAALLGVSQTYISLLEKGARPLGRELRSRLKLAHRRVTRQSPDERLRAHLRSLGYPGFAHLNPTRPAASPDVVLLDALSQPTLDARVSDALPWLVRRFAKELDWGWLVRQAKLRNLQNQLGFLTQLAMSASPEPLHNAAMKRALGELDASRLLAEATLCWSSMPPATRRWMREHRSPEAAHWNVVTRQRPDARSDSYE